MGSSFRHIVAVTSFATGTLVDGVYTEGASSATTIMASVQPANARDLQCLPEGRRTSKTYRLYSDSSLNALQTTQNPDRVTLTDGVYEVVTKDPWKNGVIEHYKYLVVKV
jgi:hypothetical protein